MCKKMSNNPKGLKTKTKKMDSIPCQTDSTVFRQIKGALRKVMDSLCLWDLTNTLSRENPSACATIGFRGFLRWCSEDVKGCVGGRRTFYYRSLRVNLFVYLQEILLKETAWLQRENCQLWQINVTVSSSFPCRRHRWPGPVMRHPSICPQVTMDRTIFEKPLSGKKAHMLNNNIRTLWPFEFDIIIVDYAIF